MSKYIDLKEQIVDDSGTISPHVKIGIEEALDWLDDHADRAPGRTITASEFDEAVESCITEDGTVPPHEFAERLGVVCVPDPVPTNAELLAKEMLESFNRCEFDREPTWKQMAEALAARGVKAPGGETNEH